MSEPLAGDALQVLQRFLAVFLVYQRLARVQLVILNIALPRFERQHAFNVRRITRRLIPPAQRQNRPCRAESHARVGVLHLSAKLVDGLIQQAAELLRRRAPHFLPAAGKLGAKRRVIQPPARHSHPVHAELIRHGLIAVPEDQQFHRALLRLCERLDALRCARRSRRAHHDLAGLRPNPNVGLFPGA